MEAPPKATSSGDGIDIRASALNAVFGGSPERRVVLRILGVTTALAAIETIMPIGTLEVIAQENTAPEQSELSVIPTPT